MSKVKGNTTNNFSTDESMGDQETNDSTNKKNWSGTAKTLRLSAMQAKVYIRGGMLTTET